MSTYQHKIWMKYNVQFTRITVYIIILVLLFFFLYFNNVMRGKQIVVKKQYIRHFKSNYQAYIAGKIVTIRMILVHIGISYSDA